MATPPMNKKVGNYLIDADIDRTLGKTLNCVVFGGKHVSSGDEVAAKMFTWAKGFSTDMVDTEAKLMEDLPRHENVLQLLDYIKKDVGENLQLWLILEKCDLGDLDKFAQNTELDLKQKLDIFLQSAIGVDHIHRHHLVHRDIKMKNILVRGPSECPVIKIADFGVSRVIKGTMTNMTTLGTDAYMAPELHNKGKPSAGQAIDTFSLGVTFLTVLDIKDGATTTFKVNDVPLGEYLHQHPDTDVAALIAKPDDSDDVRRIKQVIAAMLAPTAAARPSMEEVVDQLAEICTSLCMKVLFITVNTAWKSPNLCFDQDTQPDFRIRMSATKREPEPEGAIATPYVSATDMVCFDGDNVGMFLYLFSASVDELEKGFLVAVDTWETEAVWIHLLSTWAKLCDVPADCQVKYTCICRVPQGFVVLGGEDGEDEVTSQCWLFITSNSQWRRLQDMSMARCWISAAVVNNVLVALGGKDSAGDTVDVCEWMNLATEAWTPATPLPHSMCAAFVATAAGHVYIKECDTRNFFRYDPHTDSHTEIIVPDIVPENVCGASMINLNDKLYLFDGFENLTVRYDPQTNDWMNLTPPSATYCWRYGSCAVTRAGKILLCGGSMKGGGERDVIEEYDEQEDEWKKLHFRLPFEFNEDRCLVFNLESELI